MPDVSGGEYEIVDLDATEIAMLFDDKKRVKIPEFTQVFIDHFNVRRVNGRIVCYDRTKKQYVAGIEVLKKRMLDIISTLNREQRNEIWDRVSILMSDVNGEEYPPQYVKFANGTYDLETGQLLPSNPSHVILNTVPWNYDENAQHELTDRTINKLCCGDASIRALLEEMIGYIFYRSAEFKKAFVLTGAGNNGKSVFMDMLAALTGFENFCALPIQQLGERFLTGEVYGMLAILYDDMPETYVDTASTFKNLVSGGILVGEEKGQKPYKFRPHAVPIYAANEMCRIRDSTGAAMSRFIPIPFNAVFSPTDADYDPHIRQKLITREGMEYLVQLGLAGLRRLLSNKKFTQSEVVDKELDKLKEDNDPIIGFVKENAPYERERDDYYAEYEKYCIKAGSRASIMKRDRFVRRVQLHANVELVRSTGGERYFRLKDAKSVVIEHEDTSPLSVYKDYVKRNKLQLLDEVPLCDLMSWAEAEELRRQGYVFTDDKGDYHVLADL